MMSEPNPLADQLATLCVHPDDREVLERIAKRFTHINDRGCVFISGASVGEGRPTIRWGGKMVTVARIIVCLRIQCVEMDDSTWFATHDCDDPRCVNPAHLQLGDRQSNHREAVVRGRFSSKLTDDDVRMILADQRTHRLIAADFDVDRSTVSDIKQGRTWRHLHTEGRA